MRAREILDEDYNQNFEADLNSLLIGAKGNGATEIPMQQLVNKLQSAGYSVSAASLTTLLQDNPVITNVTPEFIELSKPEAMVAQGEDPMQDTAAQVSDMAQNATKI